MIVALLTRVVESDRETSRREHYQPVKWRGFAGNMALNGQFAILFNT
jgi:hypothetical protein